ncbi:MAG: hydratase, partial [Veillonella sp.]|nr:hydratase [Veillonella sp.]
PHYVGRAKEMRTLEKDRQDGNLSDGLKAAYDLVVKEMGLNETAQDLMKNTAVSSTIFAIKPGDGSAREQAASCQRVLGAGANICIEYATKRYRSNVINWGMLPFVISTDDAKKFELGDYIWVPNVKAQLASDNDDYKAYVINEGKKEEITLHMGYLSEEEKEIIEKGCLINFYASK